MWFALGLVSLVVMVVWQIRWRWMRPWSGSPLVGRSGIAYQYRMLTHKGHTFGIQVGVPVPSFFRFDLKRETRTDRFFKWVGLSVEKQFGQYGFDRLVYVASDDAHLLNRVADSPELRAAAQRLLTQDTAGCRVRRVFCANGMLVVHFTRGSWISSKDDATRLEKAKSMALPQLEAIAKVLRAASQPNTQPRQRDPYLLPGVVVLAVSTALAINGAVFWARPALFDDAFILDRSALLPHVLWVGGAIFLALLGAHMLLLARSARAHLYLLELLIVGSFGAFSTAASELREANIEWDTSPAVTREAQLVHKSISRSRKGGTRHYLHVRDWRDPANTLQVLVSGSTYDRMDLGRVMLFHERAGYFEVAWARLIGAQEPSLDRPHLNL